MFATRWVGFARRQAVAVQELWSAARLIRRDPLALVGVAILSGFVFVAAFGPWLAPYPDEGSGTSSNLTRVLQPPSLAHPFGTDHFGRDLLSRVLFGARLALQIGVLTILLAFPFGAVLGLVAGYYRGAVEEGIMRVTDVFLALPSVIIALIIAATLARDPGIVGAIVAALLGPEAGPVIIAIAVSFWPWYTRLVHAQVLHVRSQPFVQAAVALGLPSGRIVFRHILPSAITPALIQASMDVGAAILTAAALNFLGLGPQPPTPDWGVMVQDAYATGRFSTFWWYATFPGLAIFIVVLGFNLVGDSVRELLDPKIRRRRLW